MTSAETPGRRGAARRRLLEATLPHVPSEGWTLAAMRAGAADLEMVAADVERLFPGGPDEALVLFVAEADRRMSEALEGLDLHDRRVRDRIAAAVRLRLEPLAPHREAVRRALVSLALPRNAASGLAGLYRTVDAMWRAADDSATDISFYTKRLLLSGVYLSTLLFWLDDRSEGQAASWSFLERRIDDVMTLHGVRRRLDRALERPSRRLAAWLARRRVSEREGRAPAA